MSIAEINDALRATFNLKKLRRDFDKEEFFGILEMVLRKKIMHGNCNYRGLIWYAYENTSPSDT